MVWIMINVHMTHVVHCLRVVVMGVGDRIVPARSMMNIGFGAASLVVDDCACPRSVR